MDIKEANFEIRKINNRISYLLRKKDRLFKKVTYPLPNLSEEKIIGGEKQDKYITYLIGIEEIDNELDDLYDELNNLEMWITNELKVIGKYDSLAQKIIMLREEQRMQWDKISIATNYSRIQCIRIYNKYLEKKQTIER